MHSPAAVAERNEALREANRIHCRQTRERKRNQERLLREEVDLLQLCRSIVESGPDLFSVHGLNPSAPFCFVGESFCRKLQIEPEEILGQPLSSIVDPRDAAALRSVVLHVLGGGDEGASAAAIFDGAGSGGSSASWSSAASTAIDPFFDGAASAMHQRHQQHQQQSVGAGGSGSSSSSSSWSSAASTAIHPYFDGATAAARGGSANSNGAGGGRGGGGGCLVNVRLARFSLSCYAGMSIAVGSQGLIVVTRLYVP